MPRTRRSDQMPCPEGPFVESRRLLAPDPAARVTVITAPAGSGKARLVQEWLAERWPDGRTADWVRIDLEPEDRGADGDLALSRAVHEGVEWLSAAGRVHPRFLLTGLDLLTAEQVTALVEHLLAGLPGAARIVLAGAGSGLPAGCLVRLAGDLAELRAADLWWSREELAGHLARATGVTVTEAEADQLFRVTGGWPAGAIILGRAPLPVRMEEVPEILDFVTVEILDRLAPPLRHFVLRTSVLERLAVEHCAVLVPAENPHTLLALVHRHGLTAAHWPGSAGDRNEPAPQYHRLVRAAALRVLRASAAGTERDLLQIVGEQARRRGDDPTAVTCLASAEDWEAVLRVLLSSASSGFRGWDPARLRAAVQHLPDQVWAGDLERRALVAFAAGMAGDQLLAAQVLQQTPAALRDRAAWWPVTAGLIEALRGHSGGTQSGYRAACAALVELQSLDLATRIPPILGVVDRPSLIGTAHLLAARAGVFDRDQAGVRRHLEAGWTEVGAQIPRYCVLAGLGADALTAAWGGQLAAAARRATRAQRLAVEAGLTGHPMLSLTLLARVELLRARGHSDQALAELEACAELLDRSEPFVAAASGGRVLSTAMLILRAMLRLDLAEPEAARAELERLAAEGDDPPRNLIAARAVAWARLHLCTDDVTAAERALSGVPATGAVTAARIAAALHRQAPDDAQAILRGWPFEDTLDNRIRRLLAVAAIAIARDRRPEAADQIDQALIAAEPDGHVQIFLDAPPRAQALVAAVLARSGESSGWRAELADRLDQVRSQAAAGAAAPVTRRERAVLEHLTTTMTHAQIAGQLFVSENTLKSHCRNLYRKLGVNSRAEAIRAARAQGWLGSPEIDLSPRGENVLTVNITPDPMVVEL